MGANAQCVCAALPFTGGWSILRALPQRDVFVSTGLFAIQNRARWVLLWLVSGGLLAHALVFDFINDDAFISFRYADNLVRHGELVFNPGERVEGYTNFLWTILMAGVLSLGLDVVVWSKLLGIACAIGTLWVVARFLSRTEGKASNWDALAPALLAAAPAYACWSTGGLETQLFTLLLTLGWTTFLLERDEGHEGMPWSGVWFGLSALTRPEGMLFFGLAGLYRLCEMLFVERTFIPKRKDWLWGAGFAVVFAPFFAWRWAYYGWPFPNTYYVKTGAKGFWRPGLRYFWDFVNVHLLWLIPLFAIMRRPLSGRRHGRLLILGALFVVVDVVHVVKVGGDFMALHRFFVPILPILAIWAALGIRTIIEALIAHGHSRLRLGFAGLLVVALVGTHISRVARDTLRVDSHGGVDSIGYLNQFASQCSAVGKWIAANTPADASLATTAAGARPFYARRYTVDILGLNDEWIAHNVPARGTRPGHTKSAPLQYLLDKEVDYLIYHPQVSEKEPRKRAGEKRGWKARGYRWRTEQIEGMTPSWWGVWERIPPAN